MHIYVHTKNTCTYLFVEMLPLVPVKKKENDSFCVGPAKLLWSRAQ